MFHFWSNDPRAFQRVQQTRQVQRQQHDAYLQQLQFEHRVRELVALFIQKLKELRSNPRLSAQYAVWRLAHLDRVALA